MAGCKRGGKPRSRQLEKHKPRHMCFFDKGIRISDEIHHQACCFKARNLGSSNDPDLSKSHEIICELSRCLDSPSLSL